MSSHTRNVSGDEQRESQIGTRSIKRSRTGCPECRKRKIKCDERRPICGQCHRSGKTCHLGDTLFKPHALSFETSQAHANQHSDAQYASDTDGLDAQFAEDFDDETEAVVAHDMPQQATSNPTHQGTVYFDPVANASTYLEATEMPSSPPIATATSMPSRLSGTRTHSRGIEETAFDFNSPQEARAAIISPNMSNASFHSRYQNAATASMTSGLASDKLEESFFLRHFSENIAPWFDLVNFQRYFGHECIVLVREHSLLRFATCALAAKQLGQSSMSHATAFTNNAQRNIAQHLLRGNQDFLWYGARYYDKAIKTLARSITPREPHASAASHTSPSEASPQGFFLQSDMMTRAEGEDPIVRLLATCLLIQYENLSGNTRGWTGHLNGFTKLLALLHDGIPFPTSPTSQKVFDAKSQRALRAAFWWYAINDLEESFVSHRRMRIDLDNASFWRHMGLHTHEDGEIIDLDSSETPDAPPHLQEDLLSFALIRLVSRLVNHLASPSPLAQASSTSNSGTDWNSFQSIQREFDRWASSATAAFRPDSTWHPLDTGESPSQGIFGPETWYSHSFRAATMLYYHMARMLLLIHQPPSFLAKQGSSFDLLVALREVQQQLQSHASEIVSIVNGMLDDSAVRARTIQPLYVAGRSLSDNNDRRRLVGMIRAVQDDLGLVCEYRIKHLIHEWGVSFESLGLDRRRSE